MFSYRLDDETALHLLQPQHAEMLFALIEANRTTLRTWLPWLDDVREVEHVRVFCRRGLHELAENGNFILGIWHREALAGVLEVHHIDWDDRRTSLGYWLGAEFQGKGLMTGACRTVIDHLFTHMSLNRVEIRAATGNTRSRAIPERLGFTWEGTLRQHQRLYGRYVDLEVYGMLREEWG
jgi:ribosomal-protein-serine acetyltransferase